MAVKIRLARLGCKHRPFFHIVVADDKSRSDGKQIEVIGFYDPLQGKDDAKRVSLKFDRIKYWLSVGAQPTDSVENMLFRAGLIPPKVDGCSRFEKWTAIFKPPCFTYYRVNGLSSEPTSF